MTQLAISATQIRKLLANGLSARYLLPDSVLDYIQTHSLYRNS
jgi:nicotinate-nucleotide adenylyltransferase